MPLPPSPVRILPTPARHGIAAACALLLLASCRGGESAGGAIGEGPGAGGVLPDFRLAAVSGGTLGPADLRGKVVVYDFWATWCGPCHIQADILFKLRPRLAARGVEIVSVSLGEPEEVVREFLERKPYPFPVLTDPEDRLTGELRILGLPTLIVADGEGRIVFRVTGIAGAEDIERAVERAGAA